jgi:hypothetical protein
VTTILVILGIYALISLLIAARLYVVAIGLLKRISPLIDSVLDRKARMGFVVSALTDGFGWGYYVIRYGVKTFYDELKKF